jgi:hypothetical protein
MQADREPPPGRVVDIHDDVGWAIHPEHGRDLAARAKLARVGRHQDVREHHRAEETARYHEGESWAHRYDRRDHTGDEERSYEARP